MTERGHLLEWGHSYLSKTQKGVLIGERGLNIVNTVILSLKNKSKLLRKDCNEIQSCAKKSAIWNLYQ